MKIGILTFHSQLNYGGVLQCWALQSALEQLGHEAVVLDRWLSPDNVLLERGFGAFGGRQWIRFALRVLSGLGDRALFMRVRRTKRFLRKELHLTPRPFLSWREYTDLMQRVEGMAVDALVVGSDQVWHCGDFGDPRPYLLDGAPPLPAVAYAASFGMTAIPETFTTPSGETLPSLDVYRNGLPRFRAVSCRENEGVGLCAKLGVKAVHVVDPTLLLSRTNWQNLIGGIRPETSRRKRLVCYFLSEDVRTALPILDAYARRTGATVDILVNSNAPTLLPLPKNPSTTRIWAAGIRRHLFGRVRIRATAGPLEFVRAFAEADAIISDSFHALMFSIIFAKNVRILRPSSEFRQKMFARIEEFAAHMDGPLLSADLSAALDSLESGARTTVDDRWLDAWRTQSRLWLSETLTSRLQEPISFIGSFG